MTQILEYRAAQLGEVSFPKRQIELIVMPYETPTLVSYDNRVITEIVSRGAYDGIEERNNSVRVNRDHDVSRTCGRAVRFHPSRDEGLIAELYMARTTLGEETLTLADEWETRNQRRLNKLYLGHIALTPEPAYETANVLAVRGTDNPPAVDRVDTPNLDTVKGWLLNDRYERYGSPQH